MLTSPRADSMQQRIILEVMIVKVELSDGHFILSYLIYNCTQRAFLCTTSLGHCLSLDKTLIVLAIYNAQSMVTSCSKLDCLCHSA